MILDCYLSAACESVFTDRSTLSCNAALIWEYNRALLFCLLKGCGKYETVPCYFF